MPRRPTPAWTIATQMAGSELRLTFTGVGEEDARLRLAAYLALEFMVVEPLRDMRLEKAIERR